MLATDRWQALEQAGDVANAFHPLRDTHIRVEHITQIDQALAAVREAARPAVVLARTVKGKGLRPDRDKNGWHGGLLPADISAARIAAARELLKGDA
jgi:transketolase